MRLFVAAAVACLALPVAARLSGRRTRGATRLARSEPAATLVGACLARPS